MTIFEFAQKINNSNYLAELSRNDEKLAYDLGFVVVFGYSDDNAEFRGAINDEVGCFMGGRIYQDHDRYIDAIWCKDEFSWTYKTNIPHATFEVYDGGEPYCRGIVFEKEQKGSSPKIDQNPDQIECSTLTERSAVAKEIIETIAHKLGEYPSETTITLRADDAFGFLSDLAKQYGVDIDF